MDSGSSRLRTYPAPPAPAPTTIPALAEEFGMSIASSNPYGNNNERPVRRTDPPNQRLCVVDLC
jgi:hypothetical protein